jgi:DNA-directed RNA polymerase III subunit RPC6
MDDILSPKEEELLSIIKSHITGITQEELEKELTCPIEERVELLNTLIAQRRVEVIDKNGEVKLRFQSAEDAGKYKELTPLEAAVFEYIKESSCKGICTKELTTKTGMATKSINPVLKSMQNKGSIKSVQSIQGKRKKVWMLSNLEPSADITGGIFYKNQEIDVDLINTLNFRILEYIKTHGPSPRSEISNYLRTSGLLSV